MTQNELQQGVDALGPWFHKIELPQGVTTKTTDNFGEGAKHPLPTYARLKDVIPADLTGKTVLDVGCNAGFYSFEARRRGASRVLGAEARSWHVRQARFACAALGLDSVEFRRMSLYELHPARVGTFDVVLALGLLYHLKDLFGGVEALYHVTKDLLIVETAIVPSSMKLDMPPATYGADKRPAIPLVMLENSPLATEADCNWFLPTPEGAAALLRSVGFVDVQIRNVSNSRAILSARRDPNAIEDSRRPTWLRASIVASDVPAVLSPGAAVPLSVKVTNTGHAIWKTAVELPERGHVCMGGRITSVDNPVWSQEVDWVSLPTQVAPGESVSLTALVKAPEIPGTYELELDLVSIEVSWFQECGSLPYATRFEVAG